MHPLTGTAVSDWIQLAIMLTVAWSVLVPAAVKRHADLRVFTVVPVILSSTLASTYVLRMVGAVRTTGNVPRVAAAWCTEVIVIGFCGVTTSMVIAFLIGMRSSLNDAGRRRSAAGSAILAATTIVTMLCVIAVVSVVKGPAHTPSLEGYDRIVLLLNAAVLLAAIVYSFTPQQELANTSRRWFYGYVAAATLVVLVLIAYYHGLRDFVLGATT